VSTSPVTPAKVPALSSVMTVWLSEQVLLQGRGPVINQLGHLVHADDREDHLMPDTGTFPRGQQVVHGGAEEAQGRLVECRRVRHVDHDLGAFQRLVQTLARDQVETGSQDRQTGPG
jgi:hypothetical protein